MASFPTLKTSAVAQYPATKVVAFQNQVGAVRRWHRSSDIGIAPDRYTIG